MSFADYKFCLKFCKMKPTNLPLPIQHLATTADVITDWARINQGASSSKVAQILGYMNEEYLLCLPPPPFSTPWPDRPQPWNYRFLFRRQVACIFNWIGKRRVEGSKNGFNPAMNVIVREILWHEVSVDPNEEIPSCKVECGENESIGCQSAPTAGKHPYIASCGPPQRPDASVTHMRRRAY